MSTVPIWPEFVLPVLEALADGHILPTREIRTATFDLISLDESARAEVLASGDSRAHNRAGWAITHAHKAGWIERVSRGSYRITETGREAMTAHAGGFHDYSHASKVLDPFWGTAQPTVQSSGAG